MKIIINIFCKPSPCVTVCFVCFYENCKNCLIFVCNNFEKFYRESLVCSYYAIVKNL